MHVMIDLETLGTSTGAAIAQIAAVPFSVAHDGGLDVARAFNEYVKLDGQCRRIEPNTVLWWLQQDEEARQRLVKGQSAACHLSMALYRLGLWFAERFGQGTTNPIKNTEAPALEGVWSHGATFDLPILANAYEEQGTPLPWDFRLGRDTRTLFARAGGTPNIGHLVGVPHDALADAVNQARQVRAAWVGVRA